MIKFYETLESGHDVLIGSFHTWEEADEALEDYKINNPKNKAYIIGCAFRSKEYLLSIGAFELENDN